ncbi:MAG: hypothetical protein LUH05_04155 [Candidatus Gastranaerophilales bacterium]|nr:hypothetical protein [Candidatus Gastranaerophilales bacterium]
MNKNYRERNRKNLKDFIVLIIILIISIVLIICGILKPDDCSCKKQTEATNCNCEYSIERGGK